MFWKKSIIAFRFKLFVNNLNSSSMIGLIQWILEYEQKITKKMVWQAEIKVCDKLIVWMHTLLLHLTKQL
jgi:hypothetical protein